MKQNDLVMTPGGVGRIAYVRNAPPSFSEPLAVSVILDSKKNYPTYTGTTYLARDVFLADG